jgi:phytoene desaturase
MKYDCIVIGAGMGGLTCGLKLAAAGKKVLLLERQPVAGGVGTSFKRRGFTFEASLHYVDGLADGGGIREFLDEYGVSPKIDFIELKEFGRVIYPQHDCVVKNDFISLEAMLKDAFPAEAEGIKKFFRGINTFYRQFDHFMDSRIPYWLKMLAMPILYPQVIKASCLTLEQYITKKIEDKKLRGFLATIWGFVGVSPFELSAFYYLVVLRGCWGEKTAYIKGGFNKLFGAMAERIKECGSEVRFNTTVTEILTDQGRCVKGVRTDKGEEFLADVIISDANAIDTLTKFIDHDALKRSYAQKLSLLKKSISAITVYIGLDVPAKQIGMSYPVLSVNATYDHDEAFRCCLSNDYSHCNLAVVDHSQLDPGLAPVGKSSICVMTLANYAGWGTLTTEEYDKKKKETADSIVANLEKYLPGLSSHIEVIEVGTPKTMERFAVLPQGAVYGFSQIVAQSSLSRLSQETDLKGLFLTGAWTRPGCGVHGCLVSGIDAADLALKFLKK